MTHIQTTLQKFDSKLWGYHFPITRADGDPFVAGQNRRVICKINAAHEMRCSLMPYSEGYFILMNKTLVKKLGLNEGESVQLELTKDNSEYGMDMPDTLRVLLDQDDAGRQYFEALTPGKQRSLIYLVAKVKSMDSQLSKVLAIVDHLKSQQGKLDFKMLNELIKSYNQRAKLK